MQKQTIQEWLAEAADRFGPIPRRWAFQCPACGHVATTGDFIDLGQNPNDAYKLCIGRVNGYMRPASQAADGNGCDWCAFGLLGTMGHGRVVITESGSETEVFDFAGGAEDGED